jgi:integrase/recombinase XerD
LKWGDRHQWILSLRKETTGQSFGIDRLDESQIIQYRVYLIKIKKLVPKTINKYLAAIRKWLQMQKRLGNWSHEINVPDVKEQKKKRAPRWLEPQDIAAILYGVDQEKNEFLKVRDRCMTYLELYRGIRIGENMDLQMDDVILTPGKQKIIIRQGKGGKYDEINISGSRKLIGVIQEWIDVRSSAKYAMSPYFFISFRSGQVTTGVINKMVDRIRERSNVDYTTHQLRHTFIHDVEVETGNLRLTYELARHSDFNTTILYTQPSNKEVNNLYRKLDERY